MGNHPHTAQAAEAMRLVGLEGLYLDTGAWEDWLALYADDAVFWAPAWRDETQLVDDPECEMSFIYLQSKEALRERVLRAESDKTVTTMPMARTAHFITCLSAAPGPGQAIDVRSSWSVMVYEPRSRRQHTFFGRYEHRIVFGDGQDQGRIARKKVILLNDRIPTLLAFNYL